MCYLALYRYTHRQEIFTQIGKILYLCQKIIAMEILYQTLEEHLRKTTLDFKRYLYPTINWNNRMFGLVEPRGVGKTTLLFQHIKENHSIAACKNIV